jgi:hypothetical protein
MLALTPTARIPDEMGRRKTRPTKIAFSPASFARIMETYLVGQDGAWALGDRYHDR